MRILKHRLMCTRKNEHSTNTGTVSLEDDVRFSVQPPIPDYLRHGWLTIAKQTMSPPPLLHVNWAGTANIPYVKPAKRNILPSRFLFVFF